MKCSFCLHEELSKGTDLGRVPDLSKVPDAIVIWLDDSLCLEHFQMLKVEAHFAVGLMPKGRAS